ncbi:MAG TPA: CehA/McbA family metallohydrolase [Kofleriaceae bacterium]|nr:CehA/McbA family metallohydrolase [Kofleriaceae bacterium]
MGLVAIALVLSSMHYEGDVTAAGGDYVDVPFDVPVGTVEIQITHTDGSADVILDWGVWEPGGRFRGWGGGNTEDAIIGVDESSRSYLPGPIPAGTWTVSIGKALLDGAGTGHYSIDVTCSDTATLTPQARAAFAPVVLSTERRWYKGDFHVHSVQSGDANASFAAIATLAKSRGLDFVNLSDHNTYSQHALIAAAQPSYPDFLFLRGAEITTYSGHGNSVGTHDYVDHRLGYNGRTVQGIVDDVAAQEGVFIVNHPVLDLGTQCIGCSWKHVDDTPWDKVSGMELITGNFEIGIQAFVPRVVTLWDQLEGADHHIAVVGGSDDHRAGTDTGPTASKIGSPTTLVLADNLSEAAIVKAIREGRTAVMLRNAEDPTIDLTITRADGTAAEIGDEVQDLGEVHATVHVVGTDPDGAPLIVQLWRDGEKIDQKPVTAADVKIAFRDTPGVQLRRYRAELINDLNQRLVVTSHIYVHGAAADEGCGCSTSTGRSDGLFVVGALLFVRRRAGRRSRATAARPS